MNVASTPGGLLLLSAASTTADKIQAVSGSLSLDLLYTVVVTIAGLWTVSYVSTALTMRGLRYISYRLGDEIS